MRTSDASRLASAAPVGLFEADAHGRYTFVNVRWCEMTGLMPDQARGDGWTRAIDPEDRETVVAAWRRVVRTAEPLQVE